MELPSTHLGPLLFFFSEEPRKQWLTLVCLNLCLSYYLTLLCLIRTSVHICVCIICETHMLSFSPSHKHTINYMHIYGHTLHSLTHTYQPENVTERNGGVGCAIIYTVSITLLM